VIDCEKGECVLAYAAATQENLGGYVCKHVAAATDSKSSIAQQECLRESVLDHLISQKLLKPSSKRSLVQTDEEAARNNAPTALLWRPNQYTSNFSFISVYEATTAFYSKNQRVVVSFDKSKHHFSCPCSVPQKMRTRSGLPCIHAKV
jgi:hypothetical protein